MKHFYLFFALTCLWAINLRAQTATCSASATLLTSQTSCVTTTGNNGSFSDSSTPCTSNTGSARLGWFRFVAESTSHTITVDGNSSFDAVVRAYSACGTILGSCVDATGNGGIETLTLNSLTVGNTYFILVHNYLQPSSTNAANNGYTICVTHAPPANNDCSGAITVTHQAAGSCTTTAGTTKDATQSQAGCVGTADDDVWFSFVATSTKADIRVNGAMDEVVQVFSGSCAGLSSLICQDAPEGSVLVTSLTVGSTYRVRVYSYGGTAPSDPTFTICVTTPPAPANDNCSGATTLTHEVYGSCTATASTVSSATQSQAGCTGTADDDVWFKFVATSTTARVQVTWSVDHVVQIFSGSCGALSSSVCQDEPEGQVDANSLTVGNTYFVRVYSYSSIATSSPSFTICVTSPPSPPANDACSGATSLIHQPAGACTAQSGNLTLATQSQATCTGTTATVRDVWFKFTATSTSAIIHRVASFTNVIQAFSGGASPGACGGTSLSCYSPTEVNSDPGQQGDLQLNSLTVGNVYYFRLYPTLDAAPSDGTFTVCVTTPAAINNTTCAAMSPACSSSTIVFQAQTGGTAPAGNNYGCLSTQPNPSWFYLRVGTPGDLIFTLSASADVDYALYGPYNALSNATAACGTLPAPISCSYAPDKSETVTITGATTGKVYILLVTNYADVNQIIDIRQTGGTGTSDCAILLANDLQGLRGRTQGRNNLLEWRMPANSAAKGFHVQKSENGRDFMPLAYIGKHEGEQYTFSEAQTLCKTAYYRIETEHTGGKNRLSEIVPIVRKAGDCEALVKVAPNPAQDVITLTTFDNTESIAFEILDAKGQMRAKGNTKQERGQATVSLATLPTGLYILRMRVGNDWIHERILKR